MKIESMKWIGISCALLGAALLTGCGDKKPVVPPPPAQPMSPSARAADAASGKPLVASFTAEPSSIERGQSAVLRWQVSGATEVVIDHGIGTVQSSGSSRVTPVEASTYRLTANGVGGSTTATATVTITAPPPPPPTDIKAPTSQYESFEKAIAALLQDALFDYDSNNIRGDAKNALIADAEALRKIFADFPGATVNVEGHCDEKGSAEYNLGLGDRRASAARDFLVQLGVPADKLKTISYGKERPVCTESDEACWQKNRRAHFSAGQ